MRCKVGDLAIVVRSDAGNEGKVVRCIRLIGNESLERRNGSQITGPMWEIDQPLQDWGGNVSRKAPDAFLRPIRSGDLEDETPTELIKELSNECL